MKKVTIILLLLCGSVSAQMPGARDSLIARMCSNHRASTTNGTGNAPIATFYQKLNDAQTPVCQDFDAYEKFDTLIVSLGSEGATLPGDFLRISGVDGIVGDTLRIPMQEIAYEDRWEKGGGETGSRYNVAVKEQPRYFYIHGNRLVPYPKDKKPNNRPDSLFVGYWAIGHQLASAGDSTDVYPEFREALIIKATAMVWRVRQGAGSPEAAALEAQYAGEVLKYGRKAK